MRKQGFKVMLAVSIAIAQMTACQFLCTGAWAQPAQLIQDQVQSEQVIEQLQTTLRQNYIFPDKAEEIILALSKLKLTEIKTAAELAKQATDVMGQFDKHLTLLVKKPQDSQADKLKKESWYARLGRKNSGVQKVEILAGNIGYIEMWGFDLVNSESKRALTAAMDLTARTEAIILDFRHNGGGSPDMVTLLSNYFVKEGTHLHRFKYRNGSSHDFFTSDNHSDATDYDRPLYILISAETFSAGEAFAYALKHLGRATLIGQTSKGGAHPGNMFELGHNFKAWVSISTTINNVTGGNWEHVGVIPHIKTDVGAALNTAYIDALTKVSKTATDPYHQKEMAEQIKTLSSDETKSVVVQ